MFLAKAKDIKDPLRYKTVACRNWRKTGDCPFGKKCQYYHDPSEQRYIDETKYCNYGLRSQCPYKACRFTHLDKQYYDQCVVIDTTLRDIIIELLQTETKTLPEEFPVLQAKDDSTTLLRETLTALLES